MKTLGRIAPLALLLAAAAGCGTARRGEPVVAEPPSGDAEVARGRVAFDRNCSPCHPGGEGGLGPAINNKPLPGFMIRLQVRRGFGTMPGFPENQLPDEELDAIVAYLRDRRRQDPAPAATRR